MRNQDGTVLFWPHSKLGLSHSLFSCPGILIVRLVWTKSDNVIGFLLESLLIPLIYNNHILYMLQQVHRMWFLSSLKGWAIIGLSHERCGRFFNLFIILCSLPTLTMLQWGKRGLTCCINFGLAVWWLYLWNMGRSERVSTYFKKNY